MRILVVTKRWTSGKDLIVDRFGRYFHLPLELSQVGNQCLVLAADYTGRALLKSQEGTCELVGMPLSLGQLRSVWNGAVAMSRDFAPDVVFAGGDTHLGWVGERLAGRLGTPLVFDVFDNYASFKSARIPGFKAEFKRLARRADLTVVVTEDLAELLDLSDGFAVIPNGVDMELFRPHSEEDASPRTKTVAYVGGLAENRGTTTLIRATARLRNSHSDLRLLLAGPMLDGFTVPNLDWVDYRGVVPQEMVPGLLSMADVAVLPYPDTAWARYTSAYKLLEYLACEVPVVVTDVSNYRQMAATPEAISSPEDPRDLARAIEYQLVNAVVVRRDESWSWASRATQLFSEISPLV